jgi:hypothetical protein
MWSSNRSEPTFLLPGRNGSGVAESDSFLLGDGNPEVRKLFRNACKVGFPVTSHADGPEQVFLPAPKSKSEKSFDASHLANPSRDEKRVYEDESVEAVRGSRLLKVSDVSIALEDGFTLFNANPNHVVQKGHNLYVKRISVAIS